MSSTGLNWRCCLSSPSRYGRAPFCVPYKLPLCYVIKHLGNLGSSLMQATLVEDNFWEITYISSVCTDFLQVQSIQRAIAEKRETFEFEGTTLSLDPSCTIFITMNPGYAGECMVWYIFQIQSWIWIFVWFSYKRAKEVTIQVHYCGRVACFMPDFIKYSNHSCDVHWWPL